MNPVEQLSDFCNRLELECLMEPSKRIPAVRAVIVPRSTYLAVLDAFAKREYPFRLVPSDPWDHQGAYFHGQRLEIGNVSEPEVRYDTVGLLV